MDHFPTPVALAVLVSFFVSAVGQVAHLLIDRANAVLFEDRGSSIQDYLILLAIEECQARQLVGEVLNVSRHFIQWRPDN